MVGIYFSGTGNTKYCIETFVREIEKNGHCFSIENPRAVKEIEKQDVIVLGYPIYYSNLPKIVRDFFEKNKAVFRGKKIFIIATMGLFSGDGTGFSARILKKYDAHILGGLHLRMPDCIGDERVLKKTVEQNRETVNNARKKILDAAHRFENGDIPKEGLNILSRGLGLLCQRLWFYNKTKKYADKPKIDKKKCIGCGKCTTICPTKNLFLKDMKASHNSRCTLCYRCFSNCPKQAITILGNIVYEQFKLEKYI